ncbi:MAG TPA: glycosyltransferase [Kofleriaceae bacterium]|nr:glycosyltransferase [Kofleriaceae bacterium]
MSTVLVAPAMFTGHLFPHLAIVAALRAAGHEVVLYAEPGAARFAGLLGCEHVLMTAALDHVDRFAAMATAEDVVAAFGSLAGASAPELADVIAARRIDAVVTDTFHLGAALAAQRSGVPWASLATSPFESHADFAGSPVRAVPTAGLRRSLGLASDPRDAYQQSLSPTLTLAPWPAAFDGGQLPGPTAHIGALAWDPAPDPAEQARIPALDDRPLVLVTTSTSAVEALRGDVLAYLEAAIEALADLPVHGLVTAGGFWPAGRRLPGNVTVVPYLSHSLVMARTGVVITHAGWGSISRALVHGVPMVLVPFAIDQPLNAELAETLGVGVYLPPELVAPETLHNTITELLAPGNPQRRCAREMAAGIAARPPAAQAAQRIAAALGT